MARTGPETAADTLTTAAQADPADLVGLSPPLATATPAAQGPVLLPPPAARADYQLGGAYRPPAGVRIISRDRLASPASGTYGICYVNAFQTQPQESGWWRSHHPELLLHDSSRREVADPNWPGEVLLDTRTAAARRQELLERCWDEHADPASNVLDAVIALLRRKLGAPNPVATVRGIGFRILEPAS